MTSTMMMMMMMMMMMSSDPNTGVDCDKDRAAKEHDGKDEDYDSVGS